MGTYLTHIPYTNGDLLSLALTFIQIIETNTADTVTLETINEHGLAPAKALVASTTALSAAEGAERAARAAEVKSEDEADDELREGFTTAHIRGGAEAKDTLKSTSGGRTYGEVVKLHGQEQVRVVRDITTQAKAAPDRLGFSAGHLERIETTNEALATHNAARQAAELHSAAALLTRRQDEASFGAAARVVVRILTALHGRDKLATILPRFEHPKSSKAAETTQTAETAGTTETSGGSAS